MTLLVNIALVWFVMSIAAAICFVLVAPSDDDDQPRPPTWGEH